MTESSAKGTGYPVINLLVMCVPISMKTDNDLPSLVTPFLVNRNGYWIVGYWLSTYECGCCM